MPKRVDHEVRRRQIAEALLRLASAHGLLTVTMRDVAAEAGVSLRLVQYYFNTKDELWIGSLPYLAELLTARVTAAIRARGLPPTPRDLVECTFLAILPTDEESRWITKTYNAFYALILAKPRLTDHGAPDPDALERLMTTSLSQAQQAGDIDDSHDAALTAAGLLALTNGLGASVLGGQRPAEEAVVILRYHLDRLFVHSTTGAAPRELDDDRRPRRFARSEGDPLAGLPDPRRSGVS